MSKRMLVVDDDRAIAQLAQVWLKAAGFETQVVYDGETALAAARAQRPDAILLDLRMPRIDGLAVQARLREDPALRDIPIIFLTANVQETARRRALAGGATGFLTKPYDARDLLDAVHRVVKGKAA
jgi:CheY-like chemotaxis protein